METLDPATTQELSPSVKSWLAENLALGRHRDQIRTVLVGGGVPEALAERELDAAESHPYLHAMRRCVVLLNKRESLLKTLDYYRRYDPAHLRVERTPLPPFADFLRDHLSVNRPGLFSGGFDHWPARHWTPRTMLDLVGADTAVEVEAGREGDPRHMQNGDRLRRTMRFAEFVDHVEDGRGNDVYMTANSFVLDSPPFAFVHEQVGNLGDGYLADTPLEKSMFLWMGPAGIVTGMHQDLNHILFCQIHGRKRFRLYPATQVPYVYNRKWVFSPVDPLQPAPSSYPMFERATVLDVTVEAGDVLYIPIGWWHHVSGETASISISLTNLDRMPNHFIEYPPDLPKRSSDAPGIRCRSPPRRAASTQSGGDHDQHRCCRTGSGLRHDPGGGHRPPRARLPGPPGVGQGRRSGDDNHYPGAGRRDGIGPAGRVREADRDHGRERARSDVGAGPVSAPWEAGRS